MMAKFSTKVLFLWVAAGLLPGGGAGWAWAGDRTDAQRTPRFQKLPVIDENGDQTGCVFRFENQCYRSLDDLQFHVFEALKKQRPELEKNPPTQISVVAVRENAERESAGHLFDGKFFVSQEALVNYLIAQLNNVRERPAVWNNLAVDGPATKAAPVGPVHAPDIARGDISGTWEISGKQEKGGVDLQARIRLLKEPQTLRLADGKTVTFFPLKDYLRTLGEVGAQGGRVDRSDAQLGLFLEEEPNRERYLYSVYKDANGELHTSRIRVLEHSGNTLTLAEKDGAKIRMEKVEDAK